MSTEVAFTKMHGTRNDFVVVNGLDNPIEIDSTLARNICNRKSGIGADGILQLLLGDDDADFTMQIINSDGSEAEMCGNGIRCLARYYRDQGYTNSRKLKVKTGAGIKEIEILEDNQFRVNMEAPIFTPIKIPVVCEEENALLMDGWSALSMGNPHAVWFTEENPFRKNYAFDAFASAISTSRLFPKGANAENVQVISNELIIARIFERGVGETESCGTGACAAMVASRLIHNTDKKVVVAVKGGTLKVEWEGSLEKEAPVFLTGPAEYCFKGTFSLEESRSNDLTMV